MIVKPFAPATAQYCKVNNVLFDVIMPACTPVEFSILCFIYRRTIGFNKDKDALSYNQIAEGTGIKGRATISKGLAGLKTKNYIICQGVRRGEMSYGVNQEFEIEVKSSSKPEPDDPKTSSEFEPEDPKTSSEIELDDRSGQENLVQKLNYASSEIELVEENLVQNLNSPKDIYFKDNLKQQHVTAVDEFDQPFPDRNPELTRCMSLYTNNISTTMNAIVVSDFEDLFNGLSPPPEETKFDWFHYAVLTAAGNQKRSWSYVKSIVKRIAKSGSLTTHQEEWQNGHTFNGQATPNGQPRATGQTDYAREYAENNDANIEKFMRNLSN